MRVRNTTDRKLYLFNWPDRVWVGPGETALVDDSNNLGPLKQGLIEKVTGPLTPKPPPPPEPTPVPTKKRAARKKAASKKVAPKKAAPTPSLEDALQ